MNQVLLSLNEAGAGSSVVENGSAVALSDSTESEFSRSNPFQAEILENLNLNGRGSDRETRHIEISLEGSNLQYEPGDSLGVYPENHPRLVDDLIAAMGWNADEAVVINKQGEARALRDALLRHYEITVLTKPLIEQVVKISGNEGLRTLLEPGHEQELRTYIEERDLLDLVQDYGLRKWRQAILYPYCAKFLPDCTRLPALKAFPDEVHVTVRTVRYEAHGRAATAYAPCNWRNV